METLTPQALLAHFHALSPDDKIVFLTSIGLSLAANKTEEPLQKRKPNSPIVVSEELNRVSKQLDNLIPAIRVVKEAMSLTVTQKAKLENQLARRNAKPRKQDRDKEIVRLHDEEGKTFGQIPRLLIHANRDWCASDGKPITSNAAEHAYRRFKASTPK